MTNATNFFDSRNLSYHFGNHKNLKKLDKGTDRTLTFENYRRIFISRFLWDGGEINTGTVENIIFRYGAAFYYQDPLSGGVFCSGTTTSVNVYGVPLTFSISLPTGEVLQTNNENTVPIYDVPPFFTEQSIGVLPPFILAEHYSQQATDLLSTATTYSKGLKKTTIIPTNDKTETLSKILAKSILEDEPFQFVDVTALTGILGEGANFHNTNHTAEGLNGILTARKTIYSEGLQRLGVRGSLLEKASYQSDTENEREDLSAVLNLELCYRTRLEAVDKINSIGGGGISCRMNPKLEREGDGLPSNISTNQTER